jgi:EpsI family protein
MLGWAGVPAHIEGIFITTPNGYYKVAEACAGVKFLVAMVAYGALVAHVCFRSWPRRIVFMAASILVPVLANGVRAFATIYVGYKTTADAASGFDHVLYGWFFFALVMGLVMAVGWPFFDRKPGDPWVSLKLQKCDEKSQSPWRAVTAAMIVVLLPIGWSFIGAAWGRVPMRGPVTLPAVAGWQRVEANGLTPWRPRYEGADRLVAGQYRDATGDVVDLVIVLYAAQGEGREMVGYGQGAAGLDDDAWVWSSDGPMIPDARSENLTAPGAVQRLAATWYLAGGTLTGSGAVVKLETLKARLLARDQVAAAVIVSAQEREGHPAERAVRSFGAALGSPRAFAESAIAEARR